MPGASIFSSFQSGPISFYRFPLPSEPAAYAIYLLIRNSTLQSQPPLALRARINLTIAGPHIRQLHICSPRAHCREMHLWSWNEATHRELVAVGLYWLNQPAQSLEVLFRNIQDHSGVELPFVPEFAHDPSRAQMLLGGNCEDILPLTAELIPTLNCPCRCLQCSYRMQKLSCGAWLLNDADNPQWHMRAEDAAPLVRKLRDAGVRYLVVTGGGEPLMNSEATLAALLEGHEVGIETGLYTNGALLTKRLARAILKETPRFVRVSVNAGSEAVHSKYHRPVTSGPLFGQVQDGVKQLALYKAETGRKTEIGLSYIVNPVNYRDCAKFAEWVAGIVKEVDRTTGRKRSAIDFVRFTPTIDYFAETQHSQDFFDEAVALIQKDAVPLLEGAGLSVTLFNHRFNHIEERKAYDKCAGCFWFAEVAPDGSMYLCSELNFFPAYRIGSLLRNSVADIWASKDRREILSGVNGTRLRGCPPFCKADAINKVAAEIRKRCKITGERERIWQWLQDLHALHCWEPDTPFAKPKTVAF